MELATCWSMDRSELAHLQSFLLSFLCVAAPVMVATSPSSSTSDFSVPALLWSRCWDWFPNIAAGNKESTWLCALHQQFS